MKGRIVFFRGVSILLFTLFVLLSCSKPKKEQMETVQIQEPAKDEGFYKTPPDFSESKVNFYIKGQKINYFSDDISIIRDVLGDPLKSEESGGMNNRKVFVDTYDGLCIDYFEKSTKPDEQDVFRNIVITDPTITVENGGKVGDTIEEVLKKYQGGFFEEDENAEKTSEGLSYERWYYYLVINSEDYGSGFTFIINEKGIVTSILVGVKAFTI